MNLCMWLFWLGVFIVAAIAFSKPAPAQSGTSPRFVDAHPMTCYP